MSGPKMYGRERVIQNTLGGKHPAKKTRGRQIVHGRIILKQILVK
jgi:hypothetical protein